MSKQFTFLDLASVLRVEGGDGKALPACLARALAPMAPPQSVIHQIIQEDDLLAADRARNVNKAERAVQRAADWAHDQELRMNWSAE